MKVKIIYRNYIPIYSGYCSFWLKKIPDIDIIIPPPKPYLKKLFKAYKLLNRFPLVERTVALFQDKIFPSYSEEKDIDIFFYVGMVPNEIPDKKYIIDLENVFLLLNNTDDSDIQKQRVIRALKHKNCTHILPWSNAAAKGLKVYFKEEHEKFKDKIEVLYPAPPHYKQIYKGQEDYSLVNKNSKIKLLCNGADFFRKGVHELLEAMHLLLREDERYELYCISNVPKDFKIKYKHPNIHFFEPTFPHEEFMKKFFLTCDIFVLPTHADTFGMVFQEALSCGLPVITTRQFATPEIINEGRNGLFIESDNLFLDLKDFEPKKIAKATDSYKTFDKKLISDLVDKIECLADNLDSYKRNTDIDFRSGGKFSLETRNKKLEKIFLEAYEK